MIDLLILLALSVVAYAGFWLGAKYQTLGNLWKNFKHFLGSFTKDEE